MYSQINHARNISKPLVTLDDVTIRIRDKFILSDTNWVIEQHQQWAIIGANGAGKTSLVRSIVGELPVVQGKIEYPGGKAIKDNICYMSFERHQRLIAREEARDESRYFSGNFNNVTTAGKLLGADGPGMRHCHGQFESITELLGIAHLLEREIRLLSTGEIRKIMIAQALLKSPRLLILDEPFEGLDVSSRSKLTQVINGLMNDQRQIILVSNRLALIPPKISHVLGLKKGKVLFQGRREDCLDADKIEYLYLHDDPYVDRALFIKQFNDSTSWKIPDLLVEMKNTTVRYKDVLVINKLNWQMKRGQNWAIAGPNGAGKTTLLSLISGDNLQAYANEIYLFGRRRGSGESIWEIKERIGMISSEFQIRYRKSIKVLDVILSGFFDSVGLYRQTTSTQRAIAKQWIEYLHMADKTDEFFNRLSYGEQRLVLLARAMVKLPMLLILDEPCQGLDRTNRKMILDVVDAIALNKKTHILFVTHHADEIPACITHMLQFPDMSISNIYSPPSRRERRGI
jgi:molybdate transport system ATP-binding protein